MWTAEQKMARTSLRTTNEPTLKSTFLWTAGLGATDFIGRQSHFETVS